MVPEGIVGPIMVILLSPVFDHDAGLDQALEEFRIETFPTKPAVEAFLAPILSKFAVFDSKGYNLLVV